MSQIITAPESLPTDFVTSVFLAGSIEQGKAEDWQKQIIEQIEDLPIRIFNPRRANWNPNWPQDPEFGPFREQVNWELNALDLATFVLFYFQPGTSSPISLLELGLLAQAEKTIVVCPRDFWRYGNVAIICNRFDISLFHILDDGIRYLRSALTLATLG